VSFVTRGDDKDSISVKSELTKTEKDPIVIETNTKPFVLKRRREQKSGQPETFIPPVIGDPASAAQPLEKKAENSKESESQNTASKDGSAVSADGSSVSSGNIAASRRRGSVAEPVPSSGRPRGVLMQKQPESSAHIFVLSSSSSEQAEDNVFLSENYAPFGRLLDCKLINTLESNIPNTPLIGIVLEDLWWTNSRGEKKLIIPAGTEVHGKMGSCVRNRMMCNGNFVLVWQITSEQVGMELQIQGTVLEKSNQPGSKDRATITDMAAGLPGRVMNNQNLNEMLQYVMAFTMGLAQGYETNTTYSNGTTIVTSNDGSTKNALAHAFDAMATVALQNISEQIAKESYYIRVAAGTEFYLYISQVTNVEKAAIADTVLSALAEQKAKKDETPEDKERRE